MKNINKVSKKSKLILECLSGSVWKGPTQVAKECGYAIPSDVSYELKQMLSAGFVVKREKGLYTISDEHRHNFVCSVNTTSSYNVIMRYSNANQSYYDISANLSLTDKTGEDNYIDFNSMNWIIQAESEADAIISMKEIHGDHFNVDRRRKMIDAIQTLLINSITEKYISMKNIEEAYRLLNEED